MYLIGRIKNILDLQEFKNNFKKKSLILITDEQYPQNLIIDFVQDKIDLLNDIKKNDKVKIFINIKGREWVNKDGSIKYFNTIQAWKIEHIDNENFNFINNDKINEDFNEFNDIDEDDINNENNDDYNYEKKKKKDKKKKKKNKKKKKDYLPF